MEVLHNVYSLDRDNLLKNLRNYLDSGWDINDTFKGHSILHMSDYIDKRELAKIIEEMWADINMKDNYGAYPFDKIIFFSVFLWS